MIYTKVCKNYLHQVRLLGFVFITATLFSSCNISKESAYFKTLQKDTTINGFITNNFESKIQVGDQLSIVASSKSVAEDEQFNKGASESSNPAVSGYTVLKDGTVLLHRLGNVHAAGLTRKQLATNLQTALAPFMNEPIVNVNYLNHKITVMGAVVTPQVMQMPEEQLSLIDVLVKSGDIRPDGMKDRIMIIRENGDQKQVKYLNLEDQSILTSPWYYVKPNDIVLVTTDYKKTMQAEKRANLQTNVALFTTGISLLLIILDRVIK